MLGPGPDELLRGVRWEGDGLGWMWAMLYFWRREYWGRVVRKVNEMAVNAASGGGQGWEAIGEDAERWELQLRRHRLGKYTTVLLLLASPLEDGKTSVSLKEWARMRILRP